MLFSCTLPCLIFSLGTFEHRGGGLCREKKFGEKLWTLQEKNVLIEMARSAGDFFVLFKRIREKKEEI